MPRECNHAIDHLVAELEINPQTEAIVAELSDIYPECKVEIEAAYETWRSLGGIDVPSPSPAMDASFYKALSQFEMVSAKAPEHTPDRKVTLGWQRWLQYAAAGLLLITAGIFIGQSIGKGAQNELAHGSYPFEGEMATLVAHHPSAAERLAQIHDVKQLPDPNDEVFAALNYALISDGSVNVRLSAIEALIHFSDHAIVRSYLIEAIPQQDSPIVQIALADALSAIHEKAALSPLNKMLESGSLRLEVADHYKEAIRILM
ncbi:MAG: HEAT repeat domain-containing protein [Saprospiraceae bacterium]|nr:HEAT repeat domain-containing protein [Saprospiraceae bacterium]